MKKWFGNDVQAPTGEIVPVGAQEKIEGDNVLSFPALGAIGFLRHIVFIIPGGFRMGVNPSRGLQRRPG
jgi:hypothetical protein